MSKRRRIAVANWKMYGKLTSGLALARRICTLVEENSPLSYDVVLCPPATLTWSASEVIDGVYSLSIGGQDCHYESYGPYTGDISAAMLSDLGAKFVILGHSERRIAHGETNAFIARKIEAAQFAGLTAILCVGETAEDLNKDSALSVITTQLKESLPAKVRMSQLIIAYEPVWAIGTGIQPSPEDIAKMHKHIRSVLGESGETTRIIYGGSVTPANAPLILANDDIDGVLVGSASLEAESFWAIAEHCA